MQIRVKYIENPEEYYCSVLVDHEVVLSKKPYARLLVEKGKSPKVIGFTKKEVLVKLKLFEGVFADLLIPKQKTEIFSIKNGQREKILFT